MAEYYASVCCNAQMLLLLYQDHEGAQRISILPLELRLFRNIFMNQILLGVDYILAIL